MIDVVMPHSGGQHIMVSQGPAQRAAGRTQNKLLRVAIFLCVSVALVALVSLGSEGAGDAGLDTDTTAERKRLQLHQHLQTLQYMKFGGTLIGDTGVEAGNLGAYWNSAAGAEHTGGVGAYGTWGVDSVEPSGEAYAEGQKDAESAYVASRKSALGIAGDDADFNTAAAAGDGALAKPPWDNGSGGYGGAGLEGGAALGDGGAHADFGANLDGTRWERYKTMCILLLLNAIVIVITG
jgi:hypothetical protein